MTESKSHILKLSRLEGLTDGVFAIAMTILALDLHLPTHMGITTANLPQFFFSMVFFKFLIYVGSFAILGTLWVAMNFQLGLIRKLNRPYLWTHILYLMLVCIVPFSSSLLASFPKSQLAISVFAINLICANGAQYLIFRCANKYHLNGELYNNEIHKAIIQRMCVAPIFNILALIVAYWNAGLAFIILIVPTVIYLFPGKVDRFNSGY